jgi:hypothetical protein
MVVRRFCLVVAVALALAGTLRADALEDIVTEFHKLTNTTTPYGVTDGNPQAATAFLASDAFAHFGLAPSLNQIRNNPDDGIQFGVTAGAAYIDTGHIDEDAATVDFYVGWKMGDKVGLAISLPGEYRSMRNTDTFVGGINVGLPITLAGPEQGDNTWTLTPWATAASVSLSVELAQGGYIFGGGLTSNFSHKVGQLTLTLADQIGYDVGFPIGYNDEFDNEQNVSQFILKNGVKANHDFDQKWFFDAGVTYTNFLKGAYTDNYFTCFTGIGMHLGPAGQLRIGYTGDADFSNDYFTYGGEINLYFAF